MWFFHHNPIEYFDPYDVPRGVRVDSAMCKDFRYAYQREYRFLWFPLKGDKVEEFQDIPPLGSIEDIADLYPAPPITHPF
jgi:hypothetical protein